MKVAVIIEHLDAGRGGAEVYTDALVRALARDGHAVSVIAQDWTREAPSVEMRRVEARGITGAGRALSFATGACEAAATGGFDVIHSMARAPYLSIFHPHGGVTRASNEQSIRASSSPVERGLRRAARWLNTKNDVLLELEDIIYTRKPLPRFIAVSKMVASDMRRYYNVPSSQIDVVYNGVDVERFRPENRLAYRQALRSEMGVADDEVLVLLVAHNYRLKGAEVFINAVAALSGGARKVRGLIVGGGEAGPYRRLAQKLGVAGRVIFRKATSGIERVYAASDIYLHPTFYDPMSLVALEALASGLPVITTRYNGASEVITDGIEGYTVADPMDHAAITGALERLMDAKRRDEMSAAARALAVKFPFERNYAGILEVYHKAAAQGPPSDITIKRCR